MARPHKARLLADYDDTPNPLNRSLAKAVAIVYFLVVSSVATFSITSTLVVYKLDLPLLLSLCQAGVTIAATLPFKPTWSASVYGLFPLAFAYVMNLVSGLVGTERLTVPMYIALRRIGILFVICLERAVYGQTHSAACVASVLLMCFGSLVAAFNDLSFDAVGYMSVTVHNLFSAANIVLVKHNQAATEMRMPHLLFFNAFLGTPLLATAFVRSSEMSKLDQVKGGRIESCGFAVAQAKTRRAQGAAVANQ
jgi:solute carrier family 35